MVHKLAGGKKNENVCSYVEHIAWNNLDFARI